jgi:hypothetical protein
MNRTPVSSTNVASIGYDQNTVTLEVEFKDGTLYQYFDVPETVYNELLQTGSKGKFLHANVYNRYRYTKL